MKDSESSGITISLSFFWVLIWVSGAVLADGFWSTLAAVLTGGFWSLYLVLEVIFINIGLI